MGAGRKLGLCSWHVWVQTPELLFSSSEPLGMLLTFLGLNFLVGEQVSLPHRGF